MSGSTADNPLYAGDVPNALSASTVAPVVATPLPPPQTFAQRMSASESGGDPTATNKEGYAGQYQFGAARLADLGVYTPAQGEDLSKNQWKGTFSIPDSDVKTHADFLASPAAQNVVFGQHIAGIDAAIAKTPGADQMNPDGLRAVAHLGGIGGMQRFVATGGLYDPADSNGTRLSSYYAKFAGPSQPTSMPAPIQVASLPSAMPPLNALSSLASAPGDPRGAMMQRLALYRAMQGMIAPQRQQTAQAQPSPAGQPMVGGVNASIPLMAGRTA